MAGKESHSSNVSQFEEITCEVVVNIVQIFNINLCGWCNTQAVEVHFFKL